MEKLNDTPPMHWCVYVLLCRNNYIYIGSTNNFVKRMKEHASGKGSKFVKTWRPFEVIKIVPCDTGREARSLEYKLKRLKREEKVRLLDIAIGEIVRKKHVEIDPIFDMQEINKRLNNFTQYGCFNSC